MSRRIDPITVTLSSRNRKQFLDELSTALKAREGGSNDEEITALWDLAGLACGAFDIYEEDAALEDGGDDLTVLAIAAAAEALYGELSV